MLHYKHDRINIKMEHEFTRENPHYKWGGNPKLRAKHLIFVDVFILINVGGSLNFSEPWAQHITKLSSTTLSRHSSPEHLTSLEI